jgi:peroxiredoxin
MKLLPGDPFPWFTLPSTDNPHYAFHSVAGRYVLLGFLGSGARPETAAALAAMRVRRSLFDDEFACFFGISVDGSDQEEHRLVNDMPGIRFLFDLDGAVCRAPAGCCSTLCCG